MLIGVLSDTHIPTVARRLPPQVQQAFTGADLILHAGDLFSTSVLDELEQIAPVLAASGDDDDPSIDDRRVRQQHLLTLDGVRLLLVHQMPPEVFRSWMMGTEEIGKLPEWFDVLVCGHSHKPLVDRFNGILLLNPGSATLPNYELRPGTVALLRLEEGRAEAEIVELNGIKATGRPQP